MKLIISNISKEDARKIAEDFYGVMYWALKSDGIEAYPSENNTVIICENRPANKGNTADPIIKQENVCGKCGGDHFDFECHRLKTGG